MPYRIDLDTPPVDAIDVLVALGALDVESMNGGLAAILPDDVPAADVARALGREHVSVSPAVGRDDGSVWVVRPVAVRVGSMQIVPAVWPVQEGALRLHDGPAFGTGLHPTTALCLEALEREIRVSSPARLLDVGTGSGVLALAALLLGVPRAVAIDVDAAAIEMARANAATNDLQDRLALVHGGPEAVNGAWPLVTANILSAPLIEMAPAITRLVGRGGRLVLSGLRSSLAPDVTRAYRHLGMSSCDEHARDGWAAVVLRPSW